MEDAMNFGEKLKQLRTNAGLSQTKAVKRVQQNFPDANISQAYWSVLEKKSSAPRQDLLEILAALFNVPVSYFLSDRPNPHDRSIALAVAALWIDDLRSGVNPYDRLQRGVPDRVAPVYDEDELIDF